MINLEETDKQWIKLCKGHYQKEIPYRGSWVETLKPLFTKLYGWCPDEDDNYSDYLNTMFYRLLELHLKIVDDKSGINIQMRGIFNAAFYKGINRTEELPIERSIAELCSLIQSNQVIEDNVQRYELD